MGIYVPRPNMAQNDAGGNFARAVAEMQESNSSPRASQVTAWSCRAYHSRTQINAGRKRTDASYPEDVCGRVAYPLDPHFDCPAAIVPGVGCRLAAGRTRGQGRFRR